MAQIGVFSVISPMESANYRKVNLLSPPHRSYFALHSHSNTINPRSSTTPATVISQARTQPSSGRPRFYEKKPRTGNLRVSQDVPTIFKINKALSNIMKSGYSIMHYLWSIDTLPEVSYRCSKLLTHRHSLDTLWTTVLRSKCLKFPYGAMLPDDLWNVQHIDLLFKWLLLLFS